MKKIWKENAKLILIVTIAIVLTSGATYAATTMYDSNTVGYDNTTSGLRSTTVQGALDELYGNVAEVIINIKNLIGNSTLTTTNQTLTGAINELDEDITEVTTENMTSRFSASSGKITMVRYGKIRMLVFDSAKSPTTYEYFLLTSNLDAGDRPIIYTYGTLRRSDNNTSYLLWIRPDGSIGQSNYGTPAGPAMSGTIVWIVP